jgi:hypothetical protein
MIAKDSEPTNLTEDGMRAILRRIRGAIGLGLAWSIPWAAAGILLSPILRKFENALPPRSVFDLLFEGVWVGWYGFLAGVTFSFVLSLLARRRSLAELSTGKMAVWGIASSVLLTTPPMLVMLSSRPDGWRAEDPFYLIGSLVLCSTCAAASLMIARRGAPDERDIIADIERGPMSFSVSHAVRTAPNPEPVTR